MISPSLSSPTVLKPDTRLFKQVPEKTVRVSPPPLGSPFSPLFPFLPLFPLLPFALALLSTPSEVGAAIYVVPERSPEATLSKPDLALKEAA